jgi:hypothetical protein
VTRNPVRQSLKPEPILYDCTPHRPLWKLPSLEISIHPDTTEDSRSPSRYIRNKSCLLIPLDPPEGVQPHLDSDSPMHRVLPDPPSTSNPILTSSHPSHLGLSLVHPLALVPLSSPSPPFYPQAIITHSPRVVGRRRTRTLPFFLSNLPRRLPLSIPLHGQPWGQR